MEFDFRLGSPKPFRFYFFQETKYVIDGSSHEHKMKNFNQLRLSIKSTPIEQVSEAILVGVKGRLAWGSHNTHCTKKYKNFGRDPPHLTNSTQNKDFGFCPPSLSLKAH